MKKQKFQDENIALGYRIRELREKIINPKTNKPISQEELGLRTGNAKKTIGEIERGNSNPRFNTLLLVSKELNVTIHELLDFDMKKYIRLGYKYKANG
jgi:transcriptional regulator with XRE-family HTH domain